jgi:hypothetical protein
VARLHADHARKIPQQVVPSLQPAAALDGGVPHRHDLAHDTLLHEDPGELRDVTRARDMAGGVEPVRADEIRVGQAELARSSVHQRDEAVRISASHVLGERPRRVVRTLDEARLDEIANGQAFTRLEVHARLADRRGVRGDRHHVGQLRALEGEEHGHHLGQARDRHLPGIVPGEQHLACAPVLDEVRARVDAGSCRESRGDEGERGRQKEQPELHGAQPS